MRKAFVAVLLLALGAGSASAAELADEPGIIKALHRGPASSGSAFGTANSNCAGATCDTVWVGHSNAGPGGAFLGVGVGGKWDFETGIAGTDSTQGVRFWALPVRFAATRAIPDRLEWARNYGNSINDGDQNLWDARQIAGRKFVKTGVAGAWHADGLAGIHASAVPLSGAKSAWCGIREAGNTNPDGLDALTGNYLNGDLVIEFGVGNGFMPEFPGYGNLWDQMLYKDFASAPNSGTVSFEVRTELSNFVDTTAGGTGWFNPSPDPELLANFVNNPADSFMVYVGSPTEVAYDTNRRSFAEVLNMGLPYAEIFSVSGTFPFVNYDTTVTAAYAGISGSTTKRVVFRVKTNRLRSDVNVSGPVPAFNSIAGAALLDNVSVNGGAAEGFETTSRIAARSLIANIAAAGGQWATTGQPPHQYQHIENVLASGLAYADLCGGIGTPTRICNLTGNVLLAGNHDDPNHVIPATGTENYMMADMPTIDLANRTGGAKNAQGLDAATSARGTAVLQYDFYSGNMDLDESIFYRFGLRGHGPEAVQPIGGQRAWSGVLFNGSIYYNPDPFCYIDLVSLNALGMTIGGIDSLKAVVGTITQGYRFAGANLGNTEGTYWDNIRVGFVRGGDAPALSGSIWHQLQDQFPWNEGVTAGDNAAFDTTAALMNTGLNIVAPANDPGVVAGDSLFIASPYIGDGITDGVRLDLVFRIDPGPGNYVIKGNRSSGLVNRDPAHPFFNQYLAARGTFGTGGNIAHPGGIWDRHAWNSARMDSAEGNIYPVVSRGVGNPVSPGWMGTLHESDPKFAALGIDHNVCFLLDPAGAVDESNIDCSGVAPGIYGAVSATTKEGTKILPDGWFTPGTHIEYFFRRSTIASPGTFATLFDTTNVFPQDPADLNDFDADRWQSMDVLPDMWKSTRFGGAGYACVLMIDGNDRRGAERAFVFTADSLGYGKNNGAKKGWKALAANTDPNDPAGFVAANNGQAGLSFDLYEIRASESSEAGHPGVRLAANLGAIAAKGDKSGPSANMLATYRTVIYMAGDLSSQTIHDKTDAQEGADDITLIDNWVTSSSDAIPRNLWLSGDGISEDAALNSAVGFLDDFLLLRFGVFNVSENFKLLTGSPLTLGGLLPVATWAPAGRVYGMNNGCTILADVLGFDNTSAADAAPAANYQLPGSGTQYLASVARPATGARVYRTLFDGFDLLNLRGNYASLAQIGTIPGTNAGRHAWMDHVLTSNFVICSPPGRQTISVGEIPGIGGGVVANRNLGAFPNPAFAAKNVTLSFTLAKAQPITVRIYNVAGREVAQLDREGVAGRNDIKWDGNLTSGAKAAAGVYFYRVDGIDFGQGSAPNKMILLSSAQ
jgi:hypothetical protein